YPTDGGDKEEEESSGDNADDEDEEASKDDDEDEEEHLVLDESFVVPAVDPVPSAEIQRHFRPITAPEALIATVVAALPSSSPPASPLSPWSSPLPQIPSPPLPLPSPPTYT
ncbi:hypothetical protein Tco_0460038, partial [Tanacetum coccineum]